MDIALSRDMDVRPVSQRKRAPAESSAVTTLVHAVPRLYGYFYPRIGGNRSLAEDLTQDTLLSAVRSANTPTVEAELIPWLFSIARNKLIDHYRKQDRERRHLGQRIDDDEFELHAGLPDLDLESMPVRDEVITVLNELNPRFHAAIVLRYFDGCDVATVAQAMFLSETATQSLLARARNSFRAIWIARNGDSR